MGLSTPDIFWGIFFQNLMLFVGSQPQCKEDFSIVMQGSVKGLDSSLCGQTLAEHGIMQSTLLHVSMEEVSILSVCTH